MERKHKPYFAIRAYQILCRETNESMASKLGITPRSYTNKVNGFTDFTASEARQLVSIFGRSMDEIFLT